MPTVVGELLQRACFVACDKHVGEFVVLGGDVPGVLVVADAEADQQEQMDLGADGTPCLFEAPVVRGGEDSIVEVQILLDGGVLVRGAVHPIGRGANSLQFAPRPIGWTAPRTSTPPSNRIWTSTMLSSPPRTTGASKRHGVPSAPRSICSC